MGCWNPPTRLRAPAASVTPHRRAPQGNRFTARALRLPLGVVAVEAPGGRIGDVLADGVVGQPRRRCARQQLEGGEDVVAFEVRARDLDRVEDERHADELRQMVPDDGVDDLVAAHAVLDAGHSGAVRLIGVDKAAGTGPQAGGAAEG